MNFYEILGVDKNADRDQIRKAYKRLALQWHPDKNNDPEAGEKFREISEAYQVLSDLDKKTKYDQQMLSHKRINPTQNQRKNHKTNINDFFIFRDPFEIFEEFMAIFAMVPILDPFMISPMIVPLPVNIFMPDQKNVEIKTYETLFINGQIHHRLIEQKDGKRWITEYNPDGSEIKMLSDRDLDKLITKTLAKQIS